MRAMIILCGLVLCGCTSEANHLGNPFLWPGQAVANGAENAVYRQRRARVEIFVKQNHPALIDDISAGSGPALAEAFELAGVNAATRDIAVLRFQSDLPLYRNSAEALVVALMVHSG